MSAPPGDHLDRLVVERADGARRRAYDQRAVGKRLAFGDERAGADQRIFADARTVEQNRPHADQAVGADGAAVQDDVVTDHAIRPDGHRETGIGVQRRIVLDLRALAELDRFVIAAQHRAEPDAGIELEPHFADHGRVRRDPKAARFRQFRPVSVEFVDHDCPLVLRGEPASGTNIRDRKRSRKPRENGDVRNQSSAWTASTTTVPDIRLHKPAITVATITIRCGGLPCGGRVACCA